MSCNCDCNKPTSSASVSHALREPESPESPEMQCMQKVWKDNPDCKSLCKAQKKVCKIPNWDCNDYCEKNLGHGSEGTRGSTNNRHGKPIKDPNRSDGGGGTPTGNIMAEFVNCAKNISSAGKCGLPSSLFHQVAKCNKGDDDSYENNYCAGKGFYPECNNNICTNVDHTSTGPDYPYDHGHPINKKGNGESKKKEVKKDVKKDVSSSNNFLSTTSGKVTVGFGVIAALALLFLVIRKMRGKKRR